MTKKMYSGAACALLLTLGSLTANAQIDPREPQYFPGTGNFYQVVVYPTVADKTWPTAKTEAELKTFAGINGHLATLTSAPENTFVDGLRDVTPGINNSGPGQPGDAGFFNSELWVGGSQPAGETDPSAGWTWENDEGPFDFTDWLPTEPNDAGAGESYLAIGIRALDGWNDEGNVGGIFGYVVEYEYGTNEALDDFFEASSNVPKVLNVTANDLFVAEIAFVTIVTPPANGSLEEGDGEFVSSLDLIYTSDENFDGTDTFTYTFTDVNGVVSDVATVTIDVSQTEAAVEPGVNQVFFDQANVPGSPNPLTAAYQEVVVGGNASINCCRVLDTREGAGWRGRYRARQFDIGEATADLATNPTCDVLLDEFGVPKIAPGTAILRASQRGIPESRGIGSDGTAREHDLGVCLLESEVESNGIFFAETNAANVLGFEVNCAARNVAWRPFTGFVTTGPTENIEVDYPFVTPGTAECDRARDGRRGSDNVIVLNLRRDTVFDRPQPFLQRLATNVQRSIQSVRNDMCVNDEFLNELSVRVAGAASDMRRPNNNFRVNRAVRRLDNATRLALLIPTIPGGVVTTPNPYVDALGTSGPVGELCPGNPKGLFVGRLLSLKFQACSLLQQSGRGEDAKASLLGDGSGNCEIAPDIRAELPGLPLP